MKIKFTIDTGYLGGTITDIVDLPDDITDEDIKKELEQFVWDHISAWWKKVGEDDE